MFGISIYTRIPRAIIDNDTELLREELQAQPHLVNTFVFEHEGNVVGYEPRKLLEYAVTEEKRLAVRVLLEFGAQPTPSS